MLIKAEKIFVDVLFFFFGNLKTGIRILCKKFEKIV